MNKKIPLIYAPKTSKKINNNKEVYYSYLDNSKENIIVNDKLYSEYELQQKINDLFKSSDFIYKKKFLIKTKEAEEEYVIISKSYDYLLTISGNRIMIKDIIDINEAK